MNRDAARPAVRVVCRELPADLETPVSAFLKLRRAGEAAFLLESVAGGERVARYSFLGVGASRDLTVRGSQVEVREGDVRSLSDRDPIGALRHELASRTVEAAPRLPPFRGGAVGFLSYDFVRNLERLPSRASDPLAAPEARFFRFEEVVAFDHVRQTMVLMSIRNDPKDASDALDAVEGRLLLPLVRADFDRGRVGAAPEFRSNATRTRFRESIRRAKEAITAGDIFQVVLSQRWSAEWRGDSFPVYRALRRINPSPYMVYLESDGISIAAASPEMLVRVTGRHAETHPIAGTRPRSGDDVEDARREAELLADTKEIAEHVMLVDLGRNDLGRIARPGSVKVPAFQVIERYSHVSHIVSRVTAEIRDGIEPLDVLLAAFPAGTVSGAPKVRAMEIIEELEGERRGPYGGAVAYVDAGGNLDSCITIRSVVFANGMAHLQAGAGIVADSDADREFEETVVKSEALREAVRMAG